MMQQKKASIIDSELARWIFYIALIVVAVVIIRYFVNDTKLIVSSLFGK